MAEKSIIGNLFGVTPELYQLEQQGLREAQQRAAGTLAAGPGSMLNPSLAPLYAEAAQQGQMIGRGATALLGGEDPQLKMIRDVQAMRSQYDTSSPSGLRAFARDLAERGYTDFAIQAATKADAMAKAVLEQNKTAEETRILGREIKEIGADPNNPEMVIKAVVDKDGNVIQTVGQPYSKFTQKTNIKVDAGDKNVLDIDKKDAENLIKIRDAAERTIPRLEEQLKSVKQGMIQGSFNDAREVFTNTLASLGIKDKATLDLLKNTNVFNSNRIELASAVAKQLGVNPTDRDFQASLSRFASGSMQPEVAEAFINDLLAIQRKNLADANQGLNYYRENKGSFAGYNRPLPQSPTASDPLQNMSLEELRALEAKLSGKKK